MNKQTEKENQMTKPNWDLQYLALEIRHRIKESMIEAHQLGIEGKDLDSAEIDYAVSSVFYSIGFEPVESVSYPGDNPKETEQ